MAKLEVKYNLDGMSEQYIIRFNPSENPKNLSWTIERSFEDCLYFILREFYSKTNLVPTMQPFESNITNLPFKQRQTIERIVGLYNRSPELYKTLFSKESLKDLAGFFGHKISISD